MRTIAVRRPAARVRVEATPVVAAALALPAAVAHLQGVAPSLRTWWAYGAFFLAVGVAQLALAALVLARPHAPWVGLAGVAGTLAVVGMYVWSRTHGPPLGPLAGAPEDVGWVDAVTLVNELALIAVLVVLLEGAARRRAVRLVLVAGVALWAARAGGVL